MFPGHLLVAIQVFSQAGMKLPKPNNLVYPIQVSLGVTGMTQLRFPVAPVNYAMSLTGAVMISARPKQAEQRCVLLVQPVLTSDLLLLLPPPDTQYVQTLHVPLF